MAELASLHAVVRGRVQGVFFRAFVEDWAKALGLTGYVRNLPDGRSVEVKAEGEKEKLEKLLEKLKVGPRFAKVEEVKAEFGEHSGQFYSFEIRYF